MNFNNNIDMEYYKQELNDILDQEILITKLSNTISFSDIEKMDSYERTYILEKLIQDKTKEIEAKQKAYDEIKKR